MGENSRITAGKAFGYSNNKFHGARYAASRTTVDGAPNYLTDGHIAILNAENDPYSRLALLDGLTQSILGPCRLKTKKTPLAPTSRTCCERHKKFPSVTDNGRRGNFMGARQR